MLQKSGRLVLWEAMFILELHSAETQVVSSFLFDILYIFNKYSNDSYYYIYNFCAFLFFIKRDILYTETRKCFHKLINQQKG